MSNKVELHAAFTWDCDKCGTENFCRGVTMEPEHEEMEELKERFGGDDEDHEGQWMLQPTSVTCKECKTTFEVEKEAEDGKGEEWKDES